MTSQLTQHQRGLSKLPWSLLRQLHNEQRGTQDTPHVALAERWCHRLPHQLPVLICRPCQQACTSQKLHTPRLLTAEGKLGEKPESFSQSI